MYTIVAGPAGSTRFKYNNKFVKRENIPADILIKLGVGMDKIEEPVVQTVPEVHTCIFCGMGTNIFRLLNQQPVYLCNDDYYDRTMGQIAQKVRLSSE